MGGHVNSCPDGHVHQIAYNSCGHRCCPGCGWLDTQKWLEGCQRRLLPVPHHHVIFTLPHELNDVWRYNRAGLANVLFAAASETLRELLLDTKYLGGRVGILAVLHTWTQTLRPHVHLHTVVTAGGLGPDGKWKPTVKSCLLPRKVLMIKFRGKFKAMLLNAARKEQWTLPEGLDLKLLLSQLTKKPWNVKIHKAYPHAEGVAKYLAGYLKSGPIKNSRLLSQSNGQIVFGYRKPIRSDGPAKKQYGETRLPVDVFLGRWLQHVPPSGFQTVRGYGLYCANQHSRIDEAWVALAVDRPAECEDGRNWQTYCEESGWGEKICCPQCGKQLVSHHHFDPGRSPPISVLLGEQRRERA